MAYPNETASILAFLGHSRDDFDVTQVGGITTISRWVVSDPATPPTDVEVLVVRKDWAVSFARERIFQEQEIRSASIMTGSGVPYGTKLPRTEFDVREETYLKILVPAARNAISEVDTPFWWGLSRLRANRNTLLGHLQTWADDPARTADDILNFDVEGWSGWEIARP